MRYFIFIFLGLFTQYAYSDHGIRATGIVVVSSGETKSACVVGDQRPQCCVVPKGDYACSSRLTSACCGGHSDCHWSPVGGTNTCHAVSSLCDVTNSNKNQGSCLLTTGHYTASQSIPASCKSSHTGTCTYTCDSGEISGSNTCVRKCSAQTISGCVLPSGTQGQRAGTCNTDTGTCRRTCENGQWKQKSSDYTSCRNWRNCYHGNSLCSYISLNHGWTRSYGCKTNYTGNCTYSCNDRTMTITNNCRKRCTNWTPDSTKCPSVTLRHADSTTRSCKNPGFVFSYGDSHNQSYKYTTTALYEGSCSYSCNNGKPTGSHTCKNTCIGSTHSLCVNFYGANISYRRQTEGDNNKRLRHGKTVIGTGYDESNYDGVEFWGINIRKPGCIIGYRGTCTYSCNDGVMTTTANCTKRPPDRMWDWAARNYRD